METRAAIIREGKRTFEVVDLELDEPRRGEIGVRMVAAGLCHSDDHIQVGDIDLGYYPMVVGHEGAGVVEAVGPETPGWAVGDHVVFSFIPSCGRCRWCAEGISYLCDLGANMLQGARLDDPKSFRFELDGEGVGQLSGLGTFSQHTVVSTQSAVKVDAQLPLDKLVLLGCAVGTGWGSSVYAAEVHPGDVVLVLGVGGIGMNAVQGAAHAGATTVVAVDPIPLKREVAEAVGATHSFASMGEADSFVKSVTNGQGADKAVVAVGLTRGQHIAEAFHAVRKAGTVVVAGTAGAKDTEGIPLTAWDLSMQNKRIQGALFGQCNPMADIPRQVDMYRAGQLKLDELITRTYALDDVAKGYDDLREGVNIRGVILFD